MSLEIVSYSGIETKMKKKRKQIKKWKKANGRGKKNKKKEMKSKWKEIVIVIKNHINLRGKDKKIRKMEAVRKKQMMRPDLDQERIYNNYDKERERQKKERIGLKEKIRYKKTQYWKMKTVIKEL